MIRKSLSLRKPAGAFGLLLALLLIFGFAGSALAVPQPPHQFYGQVTVGGVLAPEGIEVVAKISGVEYAATATDAQGRYGYDPLFKVPADDPDTPTKEGGSNGDTVEFYVAGILAETYTFEIGGRTQLNLAIDALPDTIAPSVEATDPEVGTTGVPVDKVITVTFSEDVVPGDNFDRVALKDAEGNAVGHDVALSGNVLTITPSTNLAYHTAYTVVIPAGAVKDTAGNALAEGYTFSFTTETAPVALEKLKIEPESISLTVGDTAQLEVKAVYSDGSEVDVTNEAAYASEDKNVATVDASGLVTAVAAGETVITATYGDLSAQAHVTVQALSPGPAPVVTSINPVAAVAGKPDQSITITGQNFQDGARVTLRSGSQPDTTVVVVYQSSTELAFTVPADLAPGLYTVIVRNPDGQESVQPVVLTVYAGETPQVQVFPGTQGTQPGEIQPGGGVRVEVPVKVSRTYDSALVIIRVDDPDGRPMLAAVQGPLPANAAVKFSAGFNLPYKAGTYTVKAFVWDGWQSMNPLVEPAQLQFTAQ